MFGDVGFASSLAVVVAVSQCADRCHAARGCLVMLVLLLLSLWLWLWWPFVSLFVFRVVIVSTDMWLRCCSLRSWLRRLCGFFLDTVSVVTMIGHLPISV